MKDKQNIATPQEIHDALSVMNLPVLLKDMEDYAFYRLVKSDRQLAQLLVGDVIEKMLNGARSWDKEKDFKSVLFGSLRSLIYNENRKQLSGGNPHKNEIDVEDCSNPAELVPDKELEIGELKNLALEKLKSHNPPPDDLEELVFECWLDGNTLPREIAEFLEIDKEDVYKAIKRLERKLNPVREFFKSMGYGQG